MLIKEVLMQYDIYNGVKHQQIKLKKLIIAGVAAIGVLAAAAVPALAARPGYGEQPGYSQASACGQAHGSFAYFDGETNLGVKNLGPGTPTYHNGAEGQEPGATGYNNS